MYSSVTLSRFTLLCSQETSGKYCILCIFYITKWFGNQVIWEPIDLPFVRWKAVTGSGREVKKNNHNKILDSLLRCDNGSLFIFFMNKIVFVFSTFWFSIDITFCVFFITPFWTVTEVSVTVFVHMPLCYLCRSMQSVSGLGRHTIFDQWLCMEEGACGNRPRPFRKGQRLLFVHQ